MIRKVDADVNVEFLILMQNFRKDKGGKEVFDFKRGYSFIKRLLPIRGDSLELSSLCYKTKKSLKRKYFFIHRIKILFLWKCVKEMRFFARWLVNKKNKLDIPEGIFVPKRHFESITKKFLLLISILKYLIKKNIPLKSYSREIQRKFHISKKDLLEFYNWLLLLETKGELLKQFYVELLARYNVFIKEKGIDKLQSIKL
ncbi:MAG: hypothetical protein AB1410_00115 [Acidobacteriota bacterium]